MSAMKRWLVVSILLWISQPIFAFSNVIEIGIIAIPSPQIAQQTKNFNQLIKQYLAKRNTALVNVMNIPHLSFYQLAIPVNRLDAVETNLKKIAQQTKVFSLHLKNKPQIQGANVFWNAEDYAAFKQLENKVLDSKIPALRQGYLRQLEDPKTLSPEQQQLVKQYGIYWIKQLATPHITVFYDLPKNVQGLVDYLEQLKVTAPIFAVQYLGYGLIDYSGNVVKIVKLYPLT